MATIPTIQLLRNNNIYSSRADARSALELYKKDVPDGGVILARYSGTTGEEQIIKTLAGFVSNISTSENATVTIIDVEGAAENVQDAITNAINRLNKQDTAVVGQYVSSVSEENGIITVTRQELPSFGEKSNSGKAITAITQTNGLVDVQFGGVAAANVSVADEGNKFTATNVEGALNELYTSLTGAIGTGGTVEEQITNAINALDSSATSTNNYFDVTVAQEDGKITSLTVTNKDIASASLLGTTSDTKDNETAFGRIAKEVADRTAAIDALSTSSTVTLESAEGTESGILKVYTIKQGGAEVGTINIPKDLVVTSGSVVKGNWNDGVFTENVSGSGTALKLVIANQTTPVYINTLDLVKDHTGGNGISISDTNVISVVRDPDSENFLTVSESGVKLSGVQDAISEASGHVNSIIEARLGTGVTSDSTATAQFAELSSKLGTGVTTVATVTEQLKALSGTTGDASGVTSVEGAKKYTDDKIEELSLTPVGGNGQVITTISQTDGKVSVTAATLGAENVSASTIASSNTTVAVTGTNVSAQIASLAKSIKNVDVSEQLANYYTKTEIDTVLLNYPTNDDAKRLANAEALDEINKLNATVVSTSGTSTTEAIKIIQTNGKIASITLGAFDCGTY